MTAAGGPPPVTGLPADLRSLPFVYVDDLAAPRVAVADLHHFVRVRRVPEGDPVILGDGRGGWRRARLAEVPEPTSEIVVVEVPNEPTTVVFAPVKGDRPEWVVQKLTELGVDVIAPVRTRRSIVRWDATRAAKQHGRWLATAREAGMQSRRLHLPDVRPLGTLDDHPDVVLADPGAPALLDPATDRVVAIGPEGGWDDDELTGRSLVGLPGGILRAETAALAAAVLLALGGSSGPPTRDDRPSEFT